MVVVARWTVFRCCWSMFEGAAMLLRIRKFFPLLLCKSVVLSAPGAWENTDKKTTISKGKETCLRKRFWPKVSFSSSCWIIVRNISVLWKLLGTPFIENCSWLSLWSRSCMSTCLLMLVCLFTPGFSWFSFVLIDTENVADFFWCLCELGHLIAMKFFGREGLANQKKDTRTGTDETVHLSPSPIKMGPLALPPVFPNPLKVLVCLISLHLEVEWACRKEWLYSFWQCELSWSSTWCVPCFFAHVVGCKLNLLLRRDEIIQWSYTKVCVRSGKMVYQSAFIEIGHSEKSWPCLGTWVVVKTTELSSNAAHAAYFLLSFKCPL